MKVHNLDTAVKQNVCRDFKTNMVKTIDLGE